MTKKREVEEEEGGENTRQVDKNKEKRMRMVIDAIVCGVVELVD